MSGSQRVDARGLSCPQPALLAKQTLEEMRIGTVEVLVDSATARDNVSRVARKAGWNVAGDAETPEGTFRLVLSK